ncbi:MAG TPA: nucleotidyltransferase domain-containing protein [Chitinophagales bacterium]|nr:nucleotidyltransferase domain-containing protein [Chitinophagales bacterium]HNL07677.1 nucleotidyltransferase domain-containing protein [Chitinophagales bacterium]
MSNVLTPETVAVIHQLCQQYHVESLFLFGSAVAARFTAKSDIDFLVAFDTQSFPLADYFDNYMDFKAALEQLLHRQVDLLELQTLKNPVLAQNIHQQKQLVYARKSA